MCNDLKRDIDSFTQETERALKNNTDPSALVIRLKNLLHQVDDTLPSIHLSLRSVDSLAGKIPSSKLIQASSILQQSSSSNIKEKKNHLQFTVTLYSLFAANIRSNPTPDSSSSSPIECVWKEEARKCSLTIERIQSSSTENNNNNSSNIVDDDDSVQYNLVLNEDFNDGLYHENDDQPKKWEWRVDHIKKLFFTKSGKLLNIEDAKTSVLVIKLLKQINDKTEEEAKKVDDNGAIKTKETTPDIHRDELKLADWFAIEIWNNDEDDEDEDENGDANKDKKSKNTKKKNFKNDSIQFPMSLLLLEYVIKLALLEVSEQMNHLNASDELLNTYMS
ncbi:unnamed protein product [Cunninghamella blakesleeana]